MHGTMPQDRVGIVGHQRYSDDVLLDALRFAASVVGEPMSTSAYEALQHEHSLPMWLTVVHRFGTWNAACGAAGLEVNSQHKGRRPTWDPTTSADAVSRFLGDPEQISESYAAYSAWAKQRSDAPSGPTVKNIFGTWNEAKAAATRRS